MTASLRRAGALALALTLIAPPTWAGSFARSAKAKRSQQTQVSAELEHSAQRPLPSAAAREQLPSLPAVQRAPGLQAMPGSGRTAATPRKRPGRTKVTPRKDTRPQDVARPRIDALSPVKPGASSKPATSAKPSGSFGRISESPERDTDGNFRFSNGQAVPGSDPQGRPGKVARDGSIHYADGTRVTHDPVTGDTKATQPGQPSTLWRGTRRDESGAIRFNDGTRVPGTDREGTPGKIGADGSVSYADGTRITHDPVGGDTKAVGPNGVTIWHRGDAAADGEHTPGGFGPAGNEPSGHDTRWNDEQGAFDFGDGYGAPARDASGNLGKINGDGSIGYSDGTVFDHDSRTGDTKIRHADGRVDVWSGGDARYGGGGQGGSGQGGTHYNDDQDAFDFGDGYGAPAADASGTPGKVNSDGTISYSDGTWVSHDTRSGDTKVVRGDGSVDVYSGDDERYESDGSSDSSSSSESSSSDTSSSDTSSDSDSGSDSSSDSDSDSDSSSSDSDTSSADTDKPSSEDTKGTKGYSPGPGWTGGETGTSQGSDQRWLKGIDIVGNPGPNGGTNGGNPTEDPEPISTSVGPGGHPGDGQWAPTPWRSSGPLPGSEGVLINPNPVDAPATAGGGPPPPMPKPPVHSR